MVPLNPKTRHGSPWSNPKNPRRRKPRPLPLLGWRHLQTQALCPLSKGRTPDPAHPLRPPTHLMRMMMMMKRMRKRKRVREAKFQPLWRLAIHGTASPEQPTQPVPTLHLMEEARHAQPAPGAPRGRNAQPPEHQGHLPPTKFSLTLSLRLVLPLQLSAQSLFPLARTTAPPSPARVVVPAATRNMPSPKASQSLPSVHHATLSPPPLPLSVCRIRP